MSVDLWLKKENSLIDKETFKKGLSEVETNSPGLRFDELGDNSYDAKFWGKEMCSVDFKEKIDNAEDSGEYGQILISTNNNLSSYAQYVTASLAKSLDLVIFDPQKMEIVDPTSLEVSIEDLKKKHEQDFPVEDEVYDVYSCQPVQMDYNFFLERIFNRLIDPLKEKGLYAKVQAQKNPQTLISNLKFWIKTKDKNSDKLKDVAEVYLSAQKKDSSQNSDVEVKTVVKDKSYSEELREIISEFSKSFSNLGFADSPEFSFQKSTEPRPPQTFPN